MPGFWQFPTVSMGLGPIISIYQARFNRYLKARGFLKSEEPKSGASSAMENPMSRKRSARLVWQGGESRQPDLGRQFAPADSTVRCGATARIIQELEAIFRGAGWNVIKVVWGWIGSFARGGHQRSLSETDGGSP
jgi:pyruvate dehydrogenase E1 component